MISISRQCELVDLPRSSYYYQPHKDERYNHFLMNLIDEQFTRTRIHVVIMGMCLLYNCDMKIS
jgi:putative transposase